MEVRIQECVGISVSTGGWLHSSQDPSSSSALVAMITKMMGSSLLLLLLAFHDRPEALVRGIRTKAFLHHAHHTACGSGNEQCEEGTCPLCGANDGEPASMWEIPQAPGVPDDEEFPECRPLPGACVCSVDVEAEASRNCVLHSLGLGLHSVFLLGFVAIVEWCVIWTHPAKPSDFALSAGNQ